MGSAAATAPAETETDVLMQRDSCKERRLERKMALRILRDRTRNVGSAAATAETDVLLHA